MYAGLILAAGQARRFGSDKRQAQLASGKSLLAHVLSQYRPALDQLWVVLPPNDTFGQPLCEHYDARPVVCCEYEKGMGHSLAQGVQGILSSEHANSIKGLIVGLADMPGVSTQHVQAIITALGAEIETHGDLALVIPSYQNQAGHPRGIGTGHLRALTELEGDAGARHALNWSQARRVPIDDAGICVDIDTPIDLRHWSR